MRLEFEDPRELLELHLQEQDEVRLRDAVIECLAEILGLQAAEKRDGIDWSFEVDWERYQLRVLQTRLRAAQRVNRTSLVLEAETYDTEAGDEVAVMSNWDLDRLAYLGIVVPADACLVEPLPTEEYAHRAFWEGF